MAGNELVEIMSNVHRARKFRRLHHVGDDFDTYCTQLGRGRSNCLVSQPITRLNGNHLNMRLLDPRHLQEESRRLTRV